MRLGVIAPPCVQATPAHTGRTAGLEQGAEALLATGLLDDLRALGAEITGVARPLLPDDKVTGDPIEDLGRYNALVADAVASTLSSDAFPLLVGGTCSHLIGMLAGLQRHWGATARIGLVWFDAHGDFNTPRTTRSGMLGGMPVAVSAGLCHAVWRERAGLHAPMPTNRIVMVDVRNLDPEEAVLIAATDVTIARFEIDGAIDDIVQAVERLTDCTEVLYLHVDADVLDASQQPSHPTAEPGGPGLPETQKAIEAVMRTGRVAAFGVVSVNPSGEGGPVSVRSASDLLRAGVSAWLGVGASLSGQDRR
ncbi:MAG: arginase [Thermomicrobiales bacterium]|nr:MAG: arginase [Thermomicrobiales bacterium]